MEFREILVTPEVAEMYLQANTKNRLVKEAIVLMYSKDILKGNWKNNTGELIKISKTGVVLDGQHRLLAVKKANKAQKFGFAFGLEDSVFDVLDTGSSRSASDIFRIDGVKNATCLPAMIMFANSLTSRGLTGGKKKLTHADLLRKYESNPEYWQDIATSSMSLYHKFSGVVPPSWIGGFNAFLGQIDKEKGRNFMEQVWTGNDVTNKAINMLRSRLIQDKLASKKMPAKMKKALFIKTWNYYMTGKEPKFLRFTPSTDKFPTFVGFNYPDL